MADPRGPAEVRRWTALLLWEACRRQVRGEAVREALDSGADPRLAVEVALEHRIVSLLWRALDSAGRSEVLGDMRTWLADVCEVHRLEAALLVPRALETAVTPLTDAGFEPVILKGPAVAARYPQPGLRRMEDIDLLLPRGAHAGALRALEASGWRVVRPRGRDRYDTVLSHPEVPSLALELHYGLEAWYERVTVLDPAELWERREPIECMGTKAFGLPLGDELVVLAAHAGKPFHGFHQLVWIADLAMLTGHAAELGRGVDWEQVDRLARRGRCTTVVACALALARRAGVPVPEGLLPLPTKGWRSLALEPLLGPMWPLEHYRISTFHMRFALADSLWRRLVLLAGCGHGKTLEGRLEYSVWAPARAVRTLVRLHRRQSGGRGWSEYEGAVPDAAHEQSTQPEQVTGAELS
jgi:hypothetical protein